MVIIVMEQIALQFVSNVDLALTEPLSDLCDSISRRHHKEIH
jgi:hypothetical protein